MPVSRLGTGCPMLFVIVFLVFLGFEVRGVVSFVDIGGIVDHHCLNFLFIKLTFFFLLLIMLHTSNFIKCNKKKVFKRISILLYVPIVLYFSFVDKYWSFTCHNITEILLKVALNTIN